MKKIFLLLVLALCFLDVSVHAQSPNLGFVKEDIWYSKDPFKEGDKIKIYTLLWNPENVEFSGTVNFFDDTTLLGKKSFKLLPQTSQVIYVDWTVTAGTHKIFARIEGAKLASSKNSFEEIYIQEGETAKSTRTATKSLPNPELPDLEEGIKGVLNPEKYAEPFKEWTGNIGESLPNFIAVPIEKAITLTEGFRESVHKVTQAQQEKVEEQIGIIKVAKPGVEDKKPALLKPFKYLELFFITLFAVVFQSKTLFYITTILFSLLIIRYLWSRFV